MEKIVNIFFLFKKHVLEVWSQFPVVSLIHVLKLRLLFFSPLQFVLTSKGTKWPVIKFLSTICDIACFDGFTSILKECINDPKLLNSVHKRLQRSWFYKEPPRNLIIFSVGLGQCRDKAVDATV